MKLLLVLFVFTNFSYAEEIVVKKMVFSESTIPYLQEYPSLSVKNSYNNQLTQVMATLKCPVKKQNNPKVFWENYTRVSFKQYQILSIKIRSNYNCDGLHPFNDIDNSFNYDLVNNRVITLFDIFSKKENTFSLIRKHFYDKIEDKTCIDKMNFYLESENLFKEYLNFYFENNAMTFILKLPHGMRHCPRKVSIGYHEILTKSTYVGVLKRFEKDFLKTKDKK